MVAVPETVVKTLTEEPQLRSALCLLYLSLSQPYSPASLRVIEPVQGLLPFLQFRNGYACGVWDACNVGLDLQFRRPR
jgi:hypothetical protein